MPKTADDGSANWKQAATALLDALTELVKTVTKKVEESDAKRE